MTDAIQTTRGSLSPFEIQRYRNIVKSAIVLIVLWRLGRPSGSSEIAKILDINRETVASHLESLGLIGLVTRTDMRGGYRLTDDGQQLMLQVPGGYLLDETLTNAFGSQPHELTLHKNEAGSTTQALPEPGGMVIDVSENPTFTQGENARMSEFPTFNVGNSDIQTLKKKKEEINLKDSDSSTSFLRASNVGNSDIPVRILLENSEILFEPQTVIMRGLDLEALDTGLVLGWLAQAYSERGNLSNPAGLVYARLRSADCPRPRRKYLDDPYRYLPRAYLDAVGLETDDASRLDERPAPSAFDMGAAEEDNEPAQPLEEQSDETLKAAWNLVMERLRSEVAPSALATWAGDTKIRSYDGATVTVTARNDYACQWLRQHVAGSALSALGDLLGAANLVFVAEGGYELSDCQTHCG